MESYEGILSDQTVTSFFIQNLFHFFKSFIKIHFLQNLFVKNTQRKVSMQRSKKEQNCQVSTLFD